jgi:hypothetical protein
MPSTFTVENQGCVTTASVDFNNGVDIRTGSANPMDAIIESRPGANVLLTTDRWRMHADMHYPLEFNAEHLWRYQVSFVVVVLSTLVFFKPYLCFQTRIDGRY